MIKQFELILPPFPRGFHLITDQVIHALPELPETGLLNLFIHHTSAGLSINENADPSVRQDFKAFFNQLVPEDISYFEHTLEGPDDMPAHIKASLVGHSLTLPIHRHRLKMGTWQGIYLCEFRNRGGSRKLTLSVYS